MKIASILATFFALTFITASLASTIQSTDSTNKITPEQLSSSLPSTQATDASAIIDALALDQVSHLEIEDLDSNDLNEIDSTERTYKGGKFCKWIWIKKCEYKCKYGKKHCKYVCYRKRVYKCYKKPHYSYRAIDEESVAEPVNEDMNEMNEMDTTERTKKHCKWIWIKKCVRKCKYGKKYCKIVCFKKKVYKCY